MMDVLCPGKSGLAEAISNITQPELHMSTWHE
jgi:hypothetical protein